MKSSWRGFFRRVAAVCLAAGTTAWSAAVCYAAQIAADNASNAPYADGWQAGDNGGTGFLPWSFENDTLFYVEGIYGMDSSSPFNQLGTAWRLGLAYLDQGKDVVRAGRGLASPLQVGQTVSLVFDAPTEMTFNDGYFVRLNTGGGSICYGGVGCNPNTSPMSRVSVNIYNWINPAEWGQWGATGGATPLFNSDTDAGMRVDFELTGAETFKLTMTPLDNPGLAFTRTGALDNPGSGDIDWIEFLHFGAESHPAFDTDFYIRSLEVTGPAPATADFDNDGDVDGDDFLRWQRGVGAGNPTLSMGNADGDGDVDAADLAIWKQQYGGAASAAATEGDSECGCGSHASGPAVPEPSSALLTLGAVALLAARGLLTRAEGTSHC
jgi:hypothetical protein